MNKIFEVTPKEIGRIILLKFTAFSLLVFLCLSILIGLTALILGDNDINFKAFYQNLLYEASSNIIFLIIQVVAVSFGIWTIGGYAGVLILVKNKNKFKTGFYAILGLWALLFISSALTGGLINSITYGLDGFSSSVKSWFIFGFYLYLLLGLIHALIGGYFVGKSILELDKKTN